MPSIILTGASEGIGAEMAMQLARQHGAALQITLAARGREALERVALSCEAHGAQTLVVPTDVGVQAQCRALVHQAVARFARVDALINNAGVSAHALFEEVAAEKLGWYEDLMRMNHFGAVWCTHEALPHLKTSRGQVVAVASLAGIVGVPGRTAYSATKFAMAGFFEALRAELKPAGVAVTTAYPGVVLTKIRENGLNARGERAGSGGLDEAGAMSAQECARLILQGMTRREREVVMTAKGKLGRWLKLIAPGAIERMALKAVKTELRPHA